MRDPKRIKRMLGKIQKIWEEYPDQRFGQILFNYTPIGTRASLGTVRDPFHYQDDDFEEVLDRILKEIEIE